MLKFTQLTAQLDYPRNLKAKLSTAHSDVISFVVDHYVNTLKLKKQVVGVLNSLTFHIIDSGRLPNSYDPKNPIETAVWLDDDEADRIPKDLLLHPKEIQWDLKEVETDTPSQTPAKVTPKTTRQPQKKATETPYQPPQAKLQSKKDEPPTPKEHLFIKSPHVPQFDVNDIWMQGNIGGSLCNLYRSLPLIPTNQSQISMSTNESRMTPNDLMKLYPNHTIRTRAPAMYEKCGELTLDPILGIIIPIEGFTEKEVRQNIIEYPHLFKFTRLVDGEMKNFYSDIEINGELHNTLEVWDSLPESKVIPKTSEFIKEYVIRRYLLERDVKVIQHKYPLFGYLNPFLTLFTTPEIYRSLGYFDHISLARKCVNARITYKTSKNPLVNAIKNNGYANANCVFAPCCTEHKCSMACPDYVETSYLFERNGIKLDNPVFNSKPEHIIAAMEILKNCSRGVTAVIADKTIEVSNLITYCAICNMWKGSCMHCNVYHIRFSNYIDDIQKSWGLKSSPESLEYEQIWIASAKILIISSLDFIQFNDFQAQTLLNLIHSRMQDGLPTIIISPKVQTLAGKGMFFDRLKSILGEGAFKWS